MTTVRIVVDATDDVAKLHSPYDEDVVRIIKASIPIGKRWWDSSDRCWKLHRTFVETVKARLEGAGHRVIIERDTWGCPECPECPPCPEAKELDWAFDVLSTAILTGECGRLYKRLVSALHPDRIGNGHLLKLINSARDRLSRMGRPCS